MRVFSLAIATIGWMLIALISLPGSGFAQTDDASSVRIEATPALLELLKTWDPSIWFFTPSGEEPLSSLDGLDREDFACWGVEHFERMQELFKVLGLEGEGVNVMGDGAYNDEEDKPKLYVTWASLAPSLQGATRVEFVEKTSEPRQ